MCAGQVHIGSLQALGKVRVEARAVIDDARCIYSHRYLMIRKCRCHYDNGERDDSDDEQEAQVRGRHRQACRRCRRICGDRILRHTERCVPSVRQGAGARYSAAQAEQDLRRLRVEPAGAFDMKRWQQNRYAVRRTPHAAHDRTPE